MARSYAGFHFEGGIPNSRSNHFSQRAAAPLMSRRRIPNRENTTMMTMKRYLLICSIVAIWCPAIRAEYLTYHEIKTDAQGNIIPWYSPELGQSYDHVIGQVWLFWKKMAKCPNGVPYYLQHMVWHPECDKRGLGGDQISMAMSSWSLLYAYSGDRSLVENMSLIADYWLDHGLSGKDARWSNLPYPYNTEFHSGRYDGDMRAGKGFLQPDKAASFGAELVVLHKITGNPRYLDAATAIADTLADKVTPGDEDHSPWPFRVHAGTGEVAASTKVFGAYTTNWTGAMRLFNDLVAMKHGDAGKYRAACDRVGDWLKAHPIKTNRWGPFFEDRGNWSDTEINADTLARYILEHPEWNPDWRRDARAVLDWTRNRFGNSQWMKYGVVAINEQSKYMFPGNSHTARHAAVELLYCERTGDTSNKDAAIRQLNWATYMVADDGRNAYPHPTGKDHWLTDGYGDYVRHYLRAMAAAPELAPSDQDHLLRSSSVVTHIHYGDEAIEYTTFEPQAREKLRVTFSPASVTAGGKALPRLAHPADLDQQDGYTMELVDGVPGLLQVRHGNSGKIRIAK